MGMVRRYNFLVSGKRVGPRRRGLGWWVVSCDFAIRQQGSSKMVKCVLDLRKIPHHEWTRHM